MDPEGDTFHAIPVLKNSGRRPLAIAHGNIQLVDLDGNTTVPITRMSGGKVAAVHALQIGMLPLTIFLAVVTAPITIPVAIVTSMVSRPEDPARRLPRGWYWNDFILDPGTRRQRSGSIVTMSAFTLTDCR